MNPGFGASIYGSALCFLLATGGLTAPRDSEAAYSMKVVVSMPKGSEGEKLATTQPASTKLSPCVDAAKADAATFTITYSAVGTTGAVDADVYLVLYNPESATKYYPIIKKTLGTTSGLITARADLAALTAAKATDIYLKVSDNPGGIITETIFGGFIGLTGVAAGTWQLIGIVAPSATVNFDDPATWVAWDVGTLMLRKPWAGTSNTTCL